MPKTAPVVLIPDPYVYRGVASTWCGRAGTSTTVAGTKYAIDKCKRRIIIHRWSDDRSGTVRLVDGDGRTDKFTEHAVVNVAPDGDFNAPLRALLMLL